MRLTASKNDYTLAAIDFLDHYKSFRSYKETKFPFVIVLSGTGTFHSPYYLNY